MRSSLAPCLCRQLNATIWSYLFMSNSSSCYPQALCSARQHISGRSNSEPTADPCNLLRLSAARFLNWSQSWRFVSFVSENGNGKNNDQETDALWLLVDGFREWGVLLFMATVSCIFNSVSINCGPCELSQHLSRDIPEQSSSKIKEKKRKRSRHQIALKLLTYVATTTSVTKCVDGSKITGSFFFPFISWMCQSNNLSFSDTFLPCHQQHMHKDKEDQDYLF